jgi:hypothetical protein
VKQVYAFYFLVKKASLAEHVHEEEHEFDTWSEAHTHFVIRCKELNITEDSVDSCFFHRKEDRYSASRFGGAHSLV